MPVFDGGDWNDTPGGVGMCDGVLVAVLPTVAAAMPMTLTFDASEPSTMPVKACGSGVGTGDPGGLGTSTMCVSVATI